MPLAGLAAWAAPWNPAEQPPAPPRPGQPPAASAPSGPVPFQPGVAIDWARREVRIESHVVLRRGILEFLACLAGKEHESILRLDARATDIYMALGLIGLTPGHPPAWDEKRGDYGRPSGDLLDITCEWSADGRLRTADAFTWLREIEYARPPLARPWVFAGSLLLPDHTLAADRSGVGVALVDFPDSLITLSRGYPSDYSAMWVEANTEQIPPRGTRVCLVLRRARPREYRVHADFRGALFVDGRYASRADLADLLQLARQLDPDRVQPIDLAGMLETDARALRIDLLRLGCPADSFRFVRPVRRGSPGGIP